MKNVNDISEELKSMGSILAGMSREMPYHTPAGYFGLLAADTQAVIRNLEEKDPVTTWGKTLPYTVPPAYFEQLTQDIVTAVSAEELTVRFTNKPAFTVPEGYFEALPAQVLQAVKKASNKRDTKQVPLRPAHRFPPVRWAAAAVLLICIGLGSYITFYTPGQSANPEKILASVSTNEIQDYFQHTYRIDASRIVGNNDLGNMQLDNKDIIDYLNENGWDAVD